MKFYCVHCCHQVEAEESVTPQYITYCCPKCGRKIAQQLLMKELLNERQGTKSDPSDRSTDDSLHLEDE